MTSVAAAVYDEAAAASSSRYAHFCYAVAAQPRREGVNLPNIMGEMGDEGRS